MLATMLYGPRDIRFEDVPQPTIQKPTDAIILLAASCVCGSDLWPFRGLQDIRAPQAMGHEYCGVVIEVGSAVTTVKPGQFVVGSFCISDNTCPHCRYGFQSSCENVEFMTGAQAPLGSCTRKAGVTLLLISMFSACCSASRVCRLFCALEKSGSIDSAFAKHCRAPSRSCLAARTIPKLLQLDLSSGTSTKAARNLRSAAA